MFYKDFNVVNASEIMNKYEFSSNYKNEYTYQDPHQRLLSNFISKNTLYDSMLVYHNLGAGKCHGINTPIIMADGRVKMVQDIKRGELLMGDDSTPRTVLSLAHGKDDLYRIKYNHGEYVVNSEHILCLNAPNYPILTQKKTHYKVNWIENNDFYTALFKFTEYTKENVYNQALIFMNNITCPQIIEISVKKYIELPKFQKQILKGYKKPIEFSYRDVKEDSYQVGCKMIIDDRYKYNSSEIRLQLLAGIIDTYGILEKNNTFCIKTDNEDIIYLAQSLGFLCYKNKRGIKITGLLDSIPTKKKYTYINLNKSPLVYNFRIEKLKSDDYYGFMLDKNCRYLLGDFTVTHNTCTAISIAEGFKEYIHDLNRKILILVKNKNISKNFINELVGQCTGNEYLTPAEKALYFSTETTPERSELLNKTTRLINKTYNILTYGSFVNKVLGLKQFEKDELGRNTNRVKKENGKVIRKLQNDTITNLNNTVVIIDEAHNITNNDLYLALLQLLQKSYNTRLILLTATPIQDNPKEIIEISNLLNARDASKQLPIRNDIFKTEPVLLEKVTSEYINNKVLKGGIIKPTKYGIEKLSANLFGKVSYIGTDYETYPKEIEMGTSVLNRDGSIKVVLCEMSDYQYDVYKKALQVDLNSSDNLDLSTLIQDLDMAETPEDTIVNKSSSLYKNASDASTMVYPNNLYGRNGYELLNDIELKKRIFTEDLEKYSVKLYTLLDNIKKSKGKIFIYSNYVSAGGTALIRDLLVANGYVKYSANNYKPNKSFIIFDDSLTTDARDRLRNIFNSVENANGSIVKVIIGSPVIAEGITLKAVRQVHILEPSWNMTRINQIVGRAVRHYSHHDLPIDERDVTVFKYASVSRKNPNTFFIDKEKYILTEEKDRSNKIIERMLKEISFDCPIHKSRNILNASLDYSSKCDYVECKYKCSYEMVESESPDFTTYNIYIDFFARYEIPFITYIIKKLFNTYYIWALDDIVSKIHSINKHVSLQSIFSVLYDFISNKILLTDGLQRSGYLVTMGNYFVFNPENMNVNSSIYDKTLNFYQSRDDYSIEQFITSYLVDSESKEEVEKETIVQKQLSKQDIEFNDNLLNTQQIVGTYRQRSSKEIGIYDDKFRLIDMRKGKMSNDARKILTGMVIGSFKKRDLVDIATLLKIQPTQISLENMDKLLLSKIIEQHLVKNNLVLR